MSSASDIKKAMEEAPLPSGFEAEAIATRLQEAIAAKVAPAAQALWCNDLGMEGLMPAELGEMCEIFDLVRQGQDKQAFLRLFDLWETRDNPRTDPGDTFQLEPNRR